VTGAVITAIRSEMGISSRCSSAAPVSGAIPSTATDLAARWFGTPYNNRVAESTRFWCCAARIAVNHVIWN
jgi:hypothetical protein